jgi:hypothetical protein
MRNIEEISRIYCKELGNGKFIYGFTISYANGEFDNHIYQSDNRNDKALLLKLNTLRNSLKIQEENQ